jgi:glycosyltransferase involved in cell wall biosynthesis
VSLQGGNILQLRSGAGFFGAENVVLELAMGLKATSYKPTIGVLRNASESWRDLSVAAARKNVPVAEFHCHRAFDVAAISSLRHFVCNNGIGIVHSHGYKANLYARLATCGLPVSRVATCHPWTEVAHSSKARVYTQIDKRVLRGFDRLVAVSHEMKEQMLASRLPADKISVIPNGIDTSRFSGVRNSQALRSALGLPPDKLIVGTIGRLVPEKAQSLLIEAAKTVRSEFSNVAYVIVGDGPLRGDLQRQAVEAGLQHEFIFTGTIDQIPEALAAMDIFVLPSISEGLPMVILEAMASTRPIIASRVGEIPSVLAWGESGRLIEPDATQLAAAILELLRNPDEAARLGRNACERVRNGYSARSMTTSYTQLYAALQTANRAAFLKTAD